MPSLEKYEYSKVKAMYGRLQKKLTMVHDATKARQRRDNGLLYCTEYGIGLLYQALLSRESRTIVLESPLTREKGHECRRENVLVAYGQIRHATITMEPYHETFKGSY